MVMGAAPTLSVLLALVAGWLTLGLAGLIRPHHLGFVGRVLFPLGALVALGVALVGLGALRPGHPAEQLVLPLGLPDLPFHLRLDALSGFFLLLLGSVGAGISIFAAGYFRAGEGTAPGLLCLQYHVFLASMVLVVVADDAYFFMVAWETMALSSYFLVTTQHRIPEIRRVFQYCWMTSAASANQRIRPFTRVRQAPAPSKPASSQRSWRAARKHPSVSARKRLSV